MRHLIACPTCQRQYDATGRAPGSRMHCACGQVLHVREPESCAAAVVRCSACGGPRSGPGPECEFCGAGYTLAELDLNTVCPSCMTRVSDGARFCHSCGTPIVPEDDAGQTSEHSCPACGDGHRLRSRRIGRERLSMLECERCAGLWLGTEVFRHLERAAAEQSLPEALATAAAPAAAAAAAAVAYRPCVVCGKLMNRQNYGRHSGVILDLCRNHGVWFDHQELARILAWIRDAGPERSRQREIEEQREVERQKRLTRVYTPEDGDPWLSQGTELPEIDFLGELGKVLGRLLSR